MADEQNTPVEDEWAVAWGGKAAAQARLDQLNARVAANEMLSLDEVNEINTLTGNLSTPGDGTSQKQPCTSILKDFNLSDTLKKLGNGLVDTITSVLNSAINQVLTVADQVAGLISQTIDLITGTITDTVDAASKLKKDPKKLLSKITSGIFDTVKDIEDEIFGVLDRLLCVDKYTDQATDIQADSSNTITQGLKAESPKRRKKIKEDINEKKKFTEEQTIQVKKNVTESTLKKVTGNLNEESNVTKKAITLVEDDPISPTTETDITFLPAELPPELVSAEFTYSTYKLSTGDTVKVFIGSKGNILYTEPQTAIKYFGRS